LFCEQDLYELVNQKSADKVEPKFKVGDWVVLTAGELSTTLQIVNIDTNKRLYWFNDSSYLPIVDEECLHLWTIQDAKEGDAEARTMYDKPVWSEEDEQHIDSLLKRLDGLCRNEFERTRFAINEDKDWLESLKERIGG
jgi:hypothetical protein